jgi:uncharacterized membrane protein
VRTERLQALSDGIFAIALTLLVLEGPTVYGLGTLVALASAPVAFALFAFVAVFFAISGRTAELRRTRAAG